MSSGNPTELARKEASLIAAIEKMLPDFARACRAPDAPIVIGTKMRSPPTIIRRNIGLLAWR
jgi:hypothetical protein